MKQLKQFFFTEKRLFLGTFLFMLIHSFGTLFLPYFVAKIIDDGILNKINQLSSAMGAGCWLLH